MSLNDIRLSSRLLSQLYTDTLLETTVPLKHMQEGAPQAKIEETAEVAGKKEAEQVRPETSIQHFPEPAAPAAGAPVPLLVNEPAPQLAPAAPAEYGKTPSLGSNKKGILILVHNDTAPYLPDGELEFLSTILGACRLSIADVAIVNLFHYPQPYTSLLQQFNSRQVLLMGLTPQQIDLPFHFPNFQLQKFDRCTYLSTLPLSLISQNRELKMQLWSCLKQMFDV